MAKQNVVSEVTGTVTEILVSPGQQVATGDTVINLDSMKMELPVVALAGGAVLEILVEQGEPVSEGQTLIVLEV